MGVKYGRTGYGRHGRDNRLMPQPKKLNPFPQRGECGEFVGKCCQNCVYLDEAQWLCSKQIMLWDDLNPYRTALDNEDCPDWVTVYE